MSLGSLIKDALNPFEALKEIGLHRILEKKGQEILTKSLEECRGELLGFMLTIKNKDASDAFHRRQRARQLCLPRTYGTPPTNYRPGDEAQFIRLLTKLYMALGEAVEEKVRVEAFTRLLNKKDADFDETLLALRHDDILQWLRRAGQEISAASAAVREKFLEHWPAVKTNLQAAGRAVVETYHEADQKGADAIRGFRNSLTWLRKRR